MPLVSFSVKAASSTALAFEIKEFSADKMPVGMYHGEQKSFTQQTIGLRKDDIVYTFTDGFADQFGGESGKKFMTKRFKDLLLSIHQKPATEQEAILEKSLEEWKKVWTA